MSDDLAARAEALRALHRDRGPLLLPNVWDAASAEAVVAAGFPVVGVRRASESLRRGDDAALWSVS